MAKISFLEKALRLDADSKGSVVDLALALASARDEERGALQKFAKKPGKLRKAYYLAEVGGKLKQIPVRKARLKKIGWTKLQIIAKYLSRENAEELFALAERHTSYQLKALMRGAEPQIKTHCVLLYYTPEQYAKFEEAILSHGGERSGRGLIGKEAAIMNLIASASGEKCASSCK